MSTLQVDSIVASTSGADLNLDGAGAGVVNLATGAELNGTALTSTFNPYVAPGTSGNLLTSNGSAWTSAAAAAGGAWEVIEATALSGVTSIVLGEGNIVAGYDYHISMSMVTFSANPAARYPRLQYGTGAGPTYQTSGYVCDCRIFDHTATLGERSAITSAIIIAAPGTYTSGSGVTRPFTSEILIQNPGGSTVSQCAVQTQNTDNTTELHQVLVAGHRSTAEVYTGFKIFIDGSKTMATGTAILRRRARAV